MWGFGKCVGVLIFGGGLVGEWKLSWDIFSWGLLEGGSKTMISIFNIYKVRSKVIAQFSIQIE